MKIDGKELVLIAIRQAGVGYLERLPKWQYVAEIFRVPSTLAIKLCQYYGVNPHERVAGCTICDDSQWEDRQGNRHCECEE